MGSIQASYWAVTAERLASEGYVVAATQSGRMPSKMDRLALLRFLINKLQSDSNVNAQAIGMVGYSSGGVETILFQMTNSNVKAVITLEGSETHAPHFRAFTAQQFFDHPAFSYTSTTVPYCALYSTRSSYGRSSQYCVDFTFYDNVKGDLALIEVANLHHEGVTGEAYFANIHPSVITSDSTFSSAKDYEIVYAAISSFLNNHVKEKASSRGTFETMKSLEEEHDAENVRVLPMTESRFVGVTTDLMNQGLYSEALSVLESGLHYFPLSENLKMNIAKCYLRTDRVKDARKILFELSKSSTFKEQAIMLLESDALKK